MDILSIKNIPLSNVGNIKTYAAWSAVGDLAAFKRDY